MFDHGRHRRGRRGEPAGIAVQDAALQDELLEHRAAGRGKEAQVRAADAGIVEGAGHGGGVEPLLAHVLRERGEGVVAKDAADPLGGTSGEELQLVVGIEAPPLRRAAPDQTHAPFGLPGVAERTILVIGAPVELEPIGANAGRDFQSSANDRTKLGFHALVAVDAKHPIAGALLQGLLLGLDMPEPLGADHAGPGL